MMLKNCFLIIVCLILWSTQTFGQNGTGNGVHSTITQELCWSYNNIDSSIIGHYRYSFQKDNPVRVNYLDQAGNTVDISAGGTIKIGKCCCETSSTIPPPAEATFAQRLCLYDKGAYTSVNRYVYVSSSGGQPVLFEYVDANGDEVIVSPTATLSYGYCDCCNANMN